MKLRLLAIVTLCTAACAALPAKANADDISWISSYHEGLRQAKVSGKPILLTFRCVP